MKRREFLAATGAAGAVALAGCAGSTESPPRESEVFKAVKLSDNSLTIQTESSPLVQTRMQDGTENDSNGTDEEDTSDTGGENDTNDTQGSLGSIAGVLGALSPVGVASAAKGGRGRGVPRSNGKVVKGRNGRVKWRGGAYAAWWSNHKDEVKTVTPVIAALGVAHLAKPTADEDTLPGAGKPSEGWDKKWTKSEYQGKEISYEGVKPGWFRVGGRLVDQNSSRDFGWEAVDLKVVQDGDGSGLETKRKWKVSPPL